MKLLCLNLIWNKIMLPPQNIILFQLDFNVKFPMLRLLQFLADLKRTILGVQNRRLASKENEKES